ncbi:hypothetical protein GQ53DRAFT_786371 [Thozetella sp. PMI_491]|nr:hypothetical protein GQ53DRAFT_786371 [Thozetella sp. PMI_491]
MSNQRLVDSVSQKAQEVAKEDYDKARILISDAAKSSKKRRCTHVVCTQGIFYFVAHRSLWKPLLSRLAPMLSLSTGVIAAMFFFTYLPQLAVMIFVNGPLAVFTTILLILSESSTLINVVSRNFMLQEALLDTFDGTLVAKDATNIVSEGRQLKPGGDPIARLGKILKNPFDRFSPKALIRYLMYLPLNFIPVVGTVAFILLQGQHASLLFPRYYFQLKRWSASQKNEWVKQHEGAYSSFGIVATLLEMVPFASVFFSFTNAVGAALWAAEIETKGSQMTGTTAPGLRETAKKAE